MATAQVPPAPSSQTGAAPTTPQQANKLSFKGEPEKIQEGGSGKDPKKSHGPAAPPSSRTQHRPTPSSLPPTPITPQQPTSTPASQQSQPQDALGHGSTMASKDQNDHKVFQNGPPLRRYISRTILLVIVPPLVTIYFGIVCWVYQVPNPAVSQYGHQNALWVFYSWFVIGVFGLGISTYGLAGIEAAMLHDHYWHAPDVMTLLMHSGQTWSTPAGWFKFMKIFLQKRKPPAHRLWYLLSFLSLLVTIALPISGLSMELFDGFVDASHPPLVIGYFPGTFNDKNDLQSVNRSSQRWRISSSVNLPGAGIAYTPRDLRRDKYSYLADLPNALSTEQDVPNLFLVPQAKYPVSGNAWGLRLSYNCSVVQSASELTILPKKNRLPLSSDISNFANLGRGPSGNEVVTVYNTSVDNLFSYVELGAISNTSYMGESADLKADILEYVLWQVRTFTPISDSGNAKYLFNNTITNPILGIGSPFIDGPKGNTTTFTPDGDVTFIPNKTFFAFQQSDDYAAGPDALYQFVAEGKNGYEPWFTEIAQPIGVRCQALSEMGSATLNPHDMSFDNFTRVPPDAPTPIQHLRENHWLTTKPFGWGPYQFLRYPEIAFENLLSSTKQPLAKVFNISQAYSGYFQAHDLQTSLMRAYANEALELMYDGLDTFDVAQLAETLTATKPGKILGPGAVPPHISTIMLAIWALGCVLLGLGYGFRRRWRESLDGYSFFLLGAEYANRITDWPEDIGHYGEFYQNDNLWKVQVSGRLTISDSITKSNHPVWQRNRQGQNHEQCITICSAGPVGLNSLLQTQFLCVQRTLTRPPLGMLTGET